VVYALGFFDGVHLGHRALLQAAVADAACLGTVAGAVTFLHHPDALVLGDAPALLCTPRERVALLKKYGMAKVEMLSFDKQLMQTPWQDFYEMLKKEYGAEGFVCGEDFRFGYKGEGTAEKLKQACGQDGLSCTVVPQICANGLPVSSSRIRGLLGEGSVEQANALLGHPFACCGTVVRGKQLGRRLGFPTANVDAAPTALKRGVYAATASFDGEDYPCVVNVGVCPTVGGEKITVEAHIPDFSGDIYGKAVTLEFYKFLRPEEKFPSLEALTQAITENIRAMKDFFEKNRK